MLKIKYHKLKQVMYFVSFLLIISCQSEPIKIKIISDESSISKTIIFDSKDTIVLKGIIDSVYLSPNRIHKYSINNSKPIDFLLKNKEGILNINKREFIVFNVDYKKDGTEGSKYGLTPFYMSYYVLIDSNLVFKKIFEKEVKDEKMLNTIIDTILIKENGNYRTVEREDLDFLYKEYDTSKTVEGFIKIGKENLFIEKFWDYDINEKIPEEITVGISSDNQNYNQERRLNGITFAEDFLKFAKIWKHEYSVLDIRKKIKNKTKK